MIIVIVIAVVVVSSSSRAAVVADVIKMSVHFMVGFSDSLPRSSSHQCRN